MSKKIKPKVSRVNENKFTAIYTDEKGKEYSFQAESFNLAIKGWYNKFKLELAISGG